MIDMFKAIGRGLGKVSKKVWVTLAFIAVLGIVGGVWGGVAYALAQFRPIGWYGLETPEQRASVSGNGGPAVMVGNWLYFVGNYVDVNPLTVTYRQNEHNRVTYGAIYRVYIPEGSNSPLYEDALNSQGLANQRPHLLDESRFEDSNSRRYQLVVPKIAGFENTALWIFDKHLIYTSPHNERDRRGNMQLGRVDFFRVDLDGGNHRRIHTTAGDAIERNQFTVASIEGEVFILVHDGSMFRRINVTTRPGRVTMISENVRGVVAMPVVTAYHQTFPRPDEDGEGDLQPSVLGRYSLANSYSGIMRYAFYTEDFPDDDEEIRPRGGNRVVQYDILNNTKVTAHINEHTIELVGLSNGRLVYSVRDANWDMLGLFASGKPMVAEPRQIDMFHIDGMNAFKLLDGPYWSEPSDEVHLRTVHTPTSDNNFMYVVLNASTMHIYHNSTLRFTFPNTVIPGHDVSVSKIVLMTSNTVHFIDGAGNFRAVDLFFGTLLPLGSMTQQPDYLPWVVTRGSNELWHFSIRQFMAEMECIEDHDHGEHEHPDDEMTMAVLADLWSNPELPSREFILGRLECRFLGHTEEDCRN
jgi:hypothetical protein